MSNQIIKGSGATIKLRAEQRLADWRRRGKAKRAGQENDSLEVESAQGTPTRDGLVDEAAHENILRKEPGKTDSPGVRESCYQGPGTKW